MVADSLPVRSDKDIIKASNAFAEEHRLLSWWHLLSTLAFLAAAIGVAAVAPHWALRLLGSVTAGLLIVRSFIIYHDFKHGSILRGSRTARLILDAFGILCLTPSKVWTQTHNYHHAHTAKLVGSHVGSYMMLNEDMWSRLTPRQKLLYGVIRHPVNIAFGYFTVFLYGMCASALLRNWRKNWDSALAIVVQLVVGALVFHQWGLAMFLLAFLIPQVISHALGAYLFYAQHNFPEAYVQPREEWNFVRAAVESSSYMKCGPIMGYFTGNIGYHHVHHLNYKIPFYRLPEAMAAIPELQHPHGVTSLWPADVINCFRLKIWDANAGRLVGFPG